MCSSSKEGEQVCSLLLETKEKEHLFVGEKSFLSDTVETGEKIIEHEIFIGFNDGKVPFARVEKHNYMFFQK